MVENEHIYQIIIVYTFDLNFLIKFCGYYILITKIISTKSHKKIHPFNSRTKFH